MMNRRLVHGHHHHQQQQQLMTDENVATAHHPGGQELGTPATMTVMDLSSYPLPDTHHYGGDGHDAADIMHAGVVTLGDPMDNLPPEVAIHVLSFLSDRELGVAGSVCRNWYGLANDDVLWRERFTRRFRQARTRKQKIERMANNAETTEQPMVGDNGIPMENLTIDDLDDERLNNVLTNATQEVDQQQTHDLETGGTNEHIDDADTIDEEETQQLEGIRKLVVPSPLSNSAIWKTMYVEKHMEPQIKLLRILSENTSLGRLMDKQRLKKIESTILNPNQVLMERLGKYPHLMNAFTAKRSLVQTKLEFLQHITKNFVCCLLGLLVLTITEFVSPDFFDYPYLYIPFSWSNLGQFWPLFAYAAILCLGYNWILPQPTSLRRKIFLWSAANSVLAGLFEEWGFRYLYICSAMLSLLVADCFIKGVLLLLACLSFYAAGVLILGIVRRPLNQTNGRELITVLTSLALGAVFAYASTWWWIMWVYEVFILPVTDTLTFGQFDDIFWDESRRLFVYGMLVANSWFRDAHKYSGVLGWANSWIIGFVMMYACVHYGLLLTIVLHGLYDLEFVVLSSLITYARTQLGCLPSGPILPIVVS